MPHSKRHSVLSFGNQQSLVYQHPACTLLSGEICIPGSKSYAIRIIALALLNFGCRTRLYNYGPCDDVWAAVRCVEVLGAKVLVERDFLEICAPSRAEFLQNSFSVLPVGESALCGRMFAIIATLTSNKFSLGRSGTLKKRSFADFAQILPQLGVEISGSLAGEFSLRGPATTTTPDKPIIIDASHSSQYLTGLLFALSVLPQPPSIQLHNLVSRPYIALTLRCLEYFHGKDFIRNHNFQYFTFYPHSLPHCPQITTLFCEADWSLASNFVVLGALAGADDGLKLTNLNRFSLQADKIIVDIVRKLGAKTEWSSGTLFIQRIKIQEPQTIEIDLTDCPDLFPALSVLQSFSPHINFQFLNLNRLQDKESDRRSVLSPNFADHRAVFATLLAKLLNSPNFPNFINISSVAKSAPSFITLLNNH